MTQYSKITALCFLIEPWIVDDVETYKALQERLPTLLGEGKSSQSNNDMVVIDSDGKVQVLWPIVDQDGNYLDPDWRWPKREAEE